MKILSNFFVLKSVYKKAALPLSGRAAYKLIVVVMQAGQSLRLFQPELQQD